MSRDPGRARRRSWSALLVGALLLEVAPRPAAAADVVGDDGRTSDGALEPAERSAALMDGVSAQAPSRRGTATVLGGYDGAHETALFRSQVEVRLFSRISILGGVTMAPAGGQNSAQPRIALKAQLLAQEQSGLDLAVGLGYRRDRYADDAGAMEALVAAACTRGHASLLAGAGILTDLEGDDRKGDLRLSALWNVSRPLQLGLGASGELDLRSSDQRRGLRRDPTYELFAGPIVAWNLGDWVVLAQAGPAAFEAAGLHGGLRGMLGATTTF